MPRITTNASKSQTADDTPEPTPEVVTVWPPAPGSLARTDVPPLDRLHHSEFIKRVIPDGYDPVVFADEAGKLGPFQRIANAYHQAHTAADRVRTEPVPTLRPEAVREAFASSTRYARTWAQILATAARAAQDLCAAEDAQLAAFLETAWPSEKA